MNGINSPIGFILEGHKNPKNLKFPYNNGRKSN